MLETIREYATERLREAGEEHQSRARHAAFHANVVDEVAPNLTQADQTRWLARLDAEHPNLRAALRWAITAGEPDLARGMAAGLWRYWQLRGLLAEGRRWMEDTLAMDGGDTRGVARALLGLAGLCYWQFDLDAAEATYRRARDVAIDLDDWWMELDALLGLVVTLALTSLRQKHFEQARDELRECLQIALELGDLPGMAMDLDRLGQVAAILGDTERACVLAGAAA